MSRKRSRHFKYKTVDIKINSTLPKIFNWLRSRLFLLKAKFSFRYNSEENDYIFIDSILITPSGLTLSVNVNGKEKLGEIEIVISNIGDGNVNINYRYPPNLSGFIANLILDIGVQFNLLNNVPQDMLKAMPKSETPSEEASSVLELELFFENVTADQFCDWLIAESKDILSKLFPALGWLLEIQPPKISIQSNYERKVEMEGRLYKFGSRGNALFSPNPTHNQECIYFELRQLSSIRLHVLCRANKFAIEHFRELLGKIERNWPETRENIKRFLIDHKGESVVPFIVSMGSTINVATGEIVPEQDKYYRVEYKFRGTPLQFSAFITNYRKVLSDKYRKDIVDLIGPTSNIDLQEVQVKAVFFPIDDLDPESQKGIYGEMVVQALYDQSSMLMVEVQRHCWDKVERTWEIIFSELKRLGWIVDEETNTDSSKDISMLNVDRVIKDNEDFKEHIERQSYVDINRIEELKALVSPKYDTTRLVKMCEEANICYQNKCYLAVVMLTRAIIDHVPPIFDHTSFAQVASTYTPKSVKASLMHLEETSRNIADSALHTHIRQKETLPTKAQVNFGAELDVLLGEVARILAAMAGSRRTTAAPDRLPVSRKKGRDERIPSTPAEQNIGVRSKNQSGGVTAHTINIQSAPPQREEKITRNIDLTIIPQEKVIDDTPYIIISVTNNENRAVFCKVEIRGIYNESNENIKREISQYANLFSWSGGSQNGIKEILAGLDGTVNLVMRQINASGIYFLFHENPNTNCKKPGIYKLDLVFRGSVGEIEFFGKNTLIYFEYIEKEERDSMGGFFNKGILKLLDWHVENDMQ